MGESYGFLNPAMLPESTRHRLVPEPLQKYIRGDVINLGMIKQGCPKLYEVSKWGEGEQLKIHNFTDNLSPFVIKGGQVSPSFPSLDRPAWQYEGGNPQTISLRYADMSLSDLQLEPPPCSQSLRYTEYFCIFCIFFDIVTYKVYQRSEVLIIYYKQ